MPPGEATTGGSAPPATKPYAWAAVSSEGTQKRALEAGKKRVASQKYDYQYEQHKEYHEHDSEPHDD